MGWWVGWGGVGRGRVGWGGWVGGSLEVSESVPFFMVDESLGSPFCCITQAVISHSPDVFPLMGNFFPVGSLRLMRLQADSVPNGGRSLAFSPNWLSGKQVCCSLLPSGAFFLLLPFWVTVPLQAQPTEKRVPWFSHQNPLGI